MKAKGNNQAAIRFMRPAACFPAPCSFFPLSTFKNKFGFKPDHWFKPNRNERFVRFSMHDFKMIVNKL
jgi:hypothetical protein